MSKGIKYIMLLGFHNRRMMHGCKESCPAGEEHASETRQIESLTPDVFDHTSKGLGDFVPADTGGGNGVVIGKTKGLEPAIGLLYKIHLSIEEGEKLFDDCFITH